MSENNNEIKDSGYFQPLTQNWTGTPNLFFDDIMVNESLPVIRVIAAIIRETVGWESGIGGRVIEADIPYVTFEKKYHISTDSISKGIATAIEKGYIIRTKKGDRQTHQSARYKLNFKVATPPHRVEATPPHRVEATPPHGDIEIKNINKKTTTQTNGSGGKINKDISSSLSNSMSTPLSNDIDTDNSKTDASNREVPIYSAESKKVEIPEWELRIRREWRECGFVGTPNDKQIGRINGYITSGVSLDLIIYAMSIAAMSNKGFEFAFGSWGGFLPSRGILGKMWLARVRTVEGAKDYEKKREAEAKAIKNTYSAAADASSPTSHNCPRCQGTKTVNSEPCPKCGGKGYLGDRNPNSSITTSSESLFVEV